MNPPSIGPGEYAALGRYVRRRWSNIDVDEVVQDVCLAFWQHRDRFDVRRPLLPYLYAIARCRVMDGLRTRYRRRELGLSMADGFSVAGGQLEVDNRLDIAALMALLKPAQRRAIEATRLSGLSTYEASHRLDQSPSLIKVNCHRGIRAMQRACGPRD